MCNFGCSASRNSRAILRLAASPAVFMFRQHVSPIVPRRALPAVPRNWLPASHGIQDIEACRRRSRSCYYGVNQIEDTATIYKPNSMPIGPVSTALSMVVLLLRNSLVQVSFCCGIPKKTPLHYSYRGWSLQRESFLPLSLNLIS